MPDGDARPDSDIFSINVDINDVSHPPLSPGADWGAQGFEGAVALS